MRIAIFAGSLAVLLCCSQASSQIRPYAANPSYWQYDGRPVLLFGGSDRDNVFQWAGDRTKLADHLDLLRDSGGNYIRCTMSSREYTSEGYRWDVLPYPFAEVGGRYNLRRWNNVYWNKLRTFLRETKARGIVVQLEIWDRWNESGDSRTGNSGWYHSPWNPNNNITYEWSDSPLLKEGKTSFYSGFHRAAIVEDPILLPLQQRFVEKIVDEVVDGGFDHVLFQVDNESGIGGGDLEPDPYWARLLARTQPRNRPAWKRTSARLVVSIGRRRDGRRPFRIGAIPKSVSPSSTPPSTTATSRRTTGTAVKGITTISSGTGRKSSSTAHGRSTTRSAITSTGRRGPVSIAALRPATPRRCAKFWRAVFGGGASIRFHRHTPTRPGGLREGLGLTPEAQSHIKSLRRFVETIHIFSMEPRNDLLSRRESNEAYCLAEPGRQYAVFFTGDADRRVQIELATSQPPLQLRWLNIADSHWERETTVSGRKSLTLETPGSGHWVAVLTPATP